MYMSVPEVDTKSPICIAVNSLHVSEDSTHENDLQVEADSQVVQHSIRFAAVAAVPPVSV